MSDMQATFVNENDVLNRKGKNVSLTYIPSDIESLRHSSQVVAWCDETDCIWTFRGTELQGRQTPESAAKTHGIRAASSRVPTGPNGETYDIYLTPVPHRVSWVETTEKEDEADIVADLNAIVEHIASYAKSKNIIIPALSVNQE